MTVNDRKGTPMDNDKITVADLLYEHMKFLTDRATNCPDSERKTLIEAAENLQCLLNRLGIPEEPDSTLSLLEKDRIFLGLTFDSKILILTQIRQMNHLADEISKLVYALDHNHRKEAKKMSRSIAWRIFWWLARARGWS
jgi:hypothetical protein